jgi:hypothetical protein
MRSVVECDTANLAWRVAIAKFALEVKSVHRVVAWIAVFAFILRATEGVFSLPTFTPCKFPLDFQLE